MRKALSVILALIILITLTAPAYAADKDTLDTAVSGAAEYVLSKVKNPQVDPVSGDWAVLGLARSGYDVPDSYYAGYYRTVEKYVKDRGGVLHDAKYTEYSRVILGLTAAGYDPRNVAGYDLTAALEDFSNTVRQGANGPAYALVALDSMDYPNSQRENYIAEILRRQLDDGGWNLAGGASDDTKDQAGDPNVTGMALQALAKYQTRQEVKAATDKALAFLSKRQNADGGYTSWNSGNIECAAQALVALCELGISADDPRFVKNGKTLIDNILSFRNADGSFKHTSDGTGENQMSAEQALYALVAAQRMRDGRDSLFRMSDAVRRDETDRLPGGETGLPGKHPDVSATPVTDAGKTFADIQSHADKPAIEALAARGIIDGKSGTVFDPDATMKRAEFAAVVTRGLGLIHDSQFIVHDYFFTDVTKDDWFAEYVYVAANYGITTGTSATTFSPNGTITRQEAAVMIARAAKLCGMDTEISDTGIRNMLAQFGDYRTVSSWAQSSLAYCFSAGILDESDFGLDIEPNEFVERCEAVVMVYKLLSNALLL